jgi:heme-degrading monooxygenase HmoA
MIARVWTGAARPERIESYLSHLRERTLPQIRQIAGHRGAYVLRRSSTERVDVTVVTLWDSIDAIARFAGADTEAAVVPPEAQALLIAWDDRAVHWDVVEATSVPAPTSVPEARDGGPPRDGG